jgi:hypothetical protein
MPIDGRSTFMRAEGITNHDAIKHRNANQWIGSKERPHWSHKPEFPDVAAAKNFREFSVAMAIQPHVIASSSATKSEPQSNVRDKAQASRNSLLAPSTHSRLKTSRTRGRMLSVKLAK